MRIGNLQLSNFGSLRAATFTCDAPITLIYGWNNSGKSSVADALAWCLTGVCRGTDKRGRGLEHVLTAGAETMKVGLSLQPQPDGPANTIIRSYKGRSTALTIDGATDELAVQQANIERLLGYPSDILAALLDSRAFLDLAHADAKTVLLRVLDVKVRVDDEDLRLEQLEAKYQEAFEQRRQKKAELGAVKVPDAPTDEAPDIRQLEDQLQTLRDEEKIRLREAATDDGKRAALEAEHTAAANDWHRVEQALARTEDLSEAIAALEARLVSLDPPEGHETTLQVHRSKLAAADGRLPMLERTVGQIQTHDPKKGCVLDQTIPCQTAAKHFSGQVGTLEQAIAELKSDRDAAREALDAAREATKTRDRVESDLRALRQRQGAREALATQLAQHKGTVDRLHEEIARLPRVASIDPDLVALQARIERGQATIREARGVVDAWARHSEAKVRQAQLAKEVQALEQRVELLGPKGARVRALEAAVSIFESAINAALARFGYELHFAFDPWDVTVNGRSAVRLSESERLRVGLSLQLALADVTGLGLVVIDGADLLDGRNRGLLTELLADFDGQAIVTATRDEPPPPIDGFTVYWLELVNGVTQVQRVGEAVAV